MLPSERIACRATVPLVSSMAHLCKAAKIIFMPGRTPLKNRFPATIQGLTRNPVHQVRPRIGLLQRTQFVCLGIISTATAPISASPGAVPLKPSRFHLWSNMSTSFPAKFVAVQRRTTVNGR